jgi:DegV family protein with EDD domain
MEKKIAIISDSGCDLPAEFIQKHNIHILPLRISFSDAEFLGNGDISNSILFERMVREIPKTSLPARSDVCELFDKLEQEGYTDALYVGVSSNMSGSYNAMRVFAEDNYNSVKLHLADTRCLSVPEGYCVLEAARELEKTSSIERAIHHMKDIRSRMSIYIALPTLEYLKRSGRISLIEGAMGTLLHLNPVMTVDAEGRFQSYIKAIGYKRAIEYVAKDFLKKFGNKTVKIAITHGNCAALAQSFLERMKRLANVEESFIQEVSPVLGVHCGPGTLGMVVIF